MILKFLHCKDGQGIVEYALIIAFIALALIAGIFILYSGMDNSYRSTSHLLNTTSST